MYHNNEIIDSQTFANSYDMKLDILLDRIQWLKDKGILPYSYCFFRYFLLRIILHFESRNHCIQP